MFREDLKKIKITQLVDSTLTKNMQNLPIKFPNKKGILVLTPTLLKYMSLSLNKFKLGFCSDTYLPFGPKSRFLLFFFLTSSLSQTIKIEDTSIIESQSSLVELRNIQIYKNKYKYKYKYPLLVHPEMTFFTKSLKIHEKIIFLKFFFQDIH